MSGASSSCLETQTEAKETRQKGDAMFKSTSRADRIWELAVKIENRTIEFYNICTCRIQNQSVAIVFKHLREREQKHAVIFTRMRKERSCDRLFPEEHMAGMQSYLIAYAETLASSSAVDGDDNSSNVPLNTLQAIDHALDLERSSILFYSSIKSSAHLVEWNIVDDVTAEEHRHMRRLLELRAHLFDAKALPILRPQVETLLANQGNIRRRNQKHPARENSFSWVGKDY